MTGFLVNRTQIRHTDFSNPHTQLQRFFTMYFIRFSKIVLLVSESKDDTTTIPAVRSINIVVCSLLDVYTGWYKI